MLDSLNDVPDNTINEDLQEDNKNEEENPIQIDAEGYLVNIETHTRIRNMSFDTPISAVRLLLRTVKYSPKLKELLESELPCEKVGRSMPLDCRTRWNSCVKMMDYAISRRDDIMAFLTKITNSEYLSETETCKKYGGIMSEIESYLTKNKWEELQILRNILKFFEELTLSFSSSSSNMKNVMLTYFTMIDVFESLLDEEAEDYASAMEELELMSLNNGKLPESVRAALEAGKRKLLKYYDFADTNNLSYVACLLDPKAKSDVQKVYLSARSVNVIIEQTKELIELYSAALPNSEVVEIPKTIASPKTKKMKLSTRFLSKQLGTTINNCGTVKTISQEFMVYLAEPRLPADADVNLLSFWKSKKTTCPKLADAARIFLAVPATSVSTERSFSIARSILSLKRHSLDPETLATLMFLKVNKRIVSELKGDLSSINIFD
jgi:hypothetical protein